MPPERLLICRFAAEPPQGPLPYGDWAQTLQAEFLAACLRVEADDVDLGEPGEVRWYPDRTWAGRTYVPATSLTATGVELYGYVSFAPGDDEQEPSDFAAWADYTEDTAGRCSAAARRPPPSSRASRSTSARSPRTASRCWRRTPTTTRTSRSRSGTR